jgi:hypothetical protein
MCSEAAFRRQSGNNEELGCEQRLRGVKCRVRKGEGEGEGEGRSKLWEAHLDVG